ncbi:hypothetical protein GCM10009636_10590 [Arthrobacter koreensis]|uniref:hypothetical protein n=1 Tax=Arthrobacter koreensis TaxID=199136 RepID=UPI001264F127|nr:hypothetical protein [Arthrobacter koreensis]
MSTGIDLAAFERMLPDSEALRARADALRDTGAEVESVAASAATVWGRLQGQGIYEGPGQEIVFSAFAPIRTKAADIAEAMGEVRSAIVNYAEEAAEIRRRFETQVRPAAEAFAVETAGQTVSEWDDDRDLVERQNAIMSQLSVLAADLDAAQRACAQVLARISSGTSKETDSGSGGDPLGFAGAFAQGAGYLASGALPTTASQFDAAAKSGHGLAWGRAVEHDNGLHPFIRGIGDQIIGGYESFAGLLGKRGIPAQLEATQGLLFMLGSLTGRNAAAEQNRAEMLRQMAQVDLFKTDPSRAAGRLAFDIGTLFIPAGAAAKAGTFGRVPARAAHVELPAPRLEVTTPPTPGLHTIREAHPGLLDRLRTWAQDHTVDPQPAYAGGKPGGGHQFDVVRSEAPDGVAGGGSTPPGGGTQYGVQLPDHMNPNGPGRNPEMQPRIGASEHGPGEWRLQSSSPQGREYQEFITGVHAADGKVPEYILEYDKVVDSVTGAISRTEIRMDNFHWDKGPPPVQVYSDAKGHYAFFETRFKNSSLYNAKLDEMYRKQFSNQLTAMLQKGGNTRLEWHFLEKKVADDFLDRVLSDPLGARLVSEGRVVIQWTPMP